MRSLGAASTRKTAYAQNVGAAQAGRGALHETGDARQRDSAEAPSNKLLSWYRQLFELVIRGRGPLNLRALTTGERGSSSAE